MRRRSSTLAYFFVVLASRGHSHYTTEHDAAVDCTVDFCKTQLSRDLEYRWHIHLPSDYDRNNDDICSKCEITIQLVYDGYTWLGIGVSAVGKMTGSTAVIGRPTEEDPTVYMLEGKMKMRVRKVTGASLENTSIKYANSQTVMEFTTSFDTFGVTLEDDEFKVGISLKNPTNFIYAHGDEDNIELDYHGANNKGSIQLENLINPEAASWADLEASASTMTMQQIKSTRNTWMAHGILAFLAWGLFAPLAISAAVLRDLDLAPLWNKLPFSNAVDEKYILKEFLAKFWLYAHAGLNSLNYIFTIVAFSIAVNTTSREMGEHFDGKHPKCGLAIFALVTFQVLGGFLRPSKEIKTTARKTWEVVHHLLGITLFVLGVFQLYTGLSMYRERYSGTSGYGIIYIILGLLVLIFGFIILGGTSYKLLLQLRGGKKEKISQNTQKLDDASGMEAPNGDVGDLNFKEDDLDEKKDAKEDETDTDFEENPKEVI